MSVMTERERGRERERERERVKERERGREGGRKTFCFVVCLPHPFRHWGLKPAIETTSPFRRSATFNESSKCLNSAAMLCGSIPHCTDNKWTNALLFDVLKWILGMTSPSIDLLW